MASGSEKRGWDILELFVEAYSQKAMEIYTLKILSSDARIGSSFSSAFVISQETLSMLSTCHWSERDSMQLKFNEIWNTEILRELIAEKKDKDEDNEPAIKRPRRNISDDQHAAYAMLDSYLSDFDKHYQSVRKVLRSKVKPAESEVIKVLFAHLFAPLSNENCYIDNHIEVCDCPCGCDQIIKRGDTSLGSSDDHTWHGYVDMFIKGILPVTLLREWIDQADSQSSMEMKREGESFKLCDPHRPGTFQFIAETITNGFAQTNTDSSLKGLPVPAFGCTPSYIYIQMYDCENDLLLKKAQPLPTFPEDNFLLTVVSVWLYMNFFLFMRTDASDISRYPKLQRHTANFCEREFYKTVRMDVTEFKQASKVPAMNFELRDEV